MGLEADAVQHLQKLSSLWHRQYPLVIERPLQGRHGVFGANSPFVSIVAIIAPSPPPNSPRSTPAGRHAPAVHPAPNPAVYAA